MGDKENAGNGKARKRAMKEREGRGEGGVGRAKKGAREEGGVE